MKMLFILVVAYFIIGYKQLFGYSLWGTIWRLTLAFSGGVLATTFALLTATTAGLVIKDELQDTEMFIIMMISCCSLLFFTVIYLGISYLIRLNPFLAHYLFGVKTTSAHANCNAKDDATNCGK